MSLAPWETMSALYRRVVLAAMLALGLGILGAIASAIWHGAGLWWVTVVLLGAGILLHILGLLIRANEARKRLKATKRGK